MSRPGPWVGWRRLFSGVLKWGLLGVLLCATVHSLLTGMRDSFAHPTADLVTRSREYAVFSDGLYPMRMMVPHPVPKEFPYSVYPPYALPMFAVFFGIGGLAQGWLVVWSLSFLALGMIGWIGWHHLRFAGPAAAVLGGIAPAAISGNGYCLYQGQFSILCMGLISLQWLLLNRRRPLAAGLCWAAAMLKPQIGLAFTLPLVWGPNRGGLLIGLMGLLLLGAGALMYTDASLLDYVAVWLKPERVAFASGGTTNLMNLLGPATAMLLLVLIFLGFLAIRLFQKAIWKSNSIHSMGSALEFRGGNLRLQAILGVLGSVIFYHHPYDNIMLYPALLTTFSLALKKRHFWFQSLAVAMAITLWAPLYLVANVSEFQVTSSAISILVGLTLLLHQSGDADG